MAQLVVRNLGPVAALEPGEWTDQTASGRPAVCCPDCGAISDIPARFNLEHGIVTPAWKCPIEPCSYFEFLQLEAYGT